MCSAYDIPRFCAEFTMEEELVLYLTKKEHGCCPKEACLGLFLAEKYKPLRIVPTSLEVAFPLIHHSVDPFCRKLPRP